MKEEIGKKLRMSGIILGLLGVLGQGGYFLKSSIYDSCEIKSKKGNLELICKPSGEIEPSPYADNVGLLFGGAGAYLIGIALVAGEYYYRREKRY